MKYLICSDIHGSETRLKKIIDAFAAGNFDLLLLLGDILNFGPRNPFPEGHNPKGVASLLNPLKDKILACRGNCDAEVDQMLLEFPILSDYALVCDGATRIFCTHGHVFSPENLPCLGGIDIFLYGHTHVQELYKTGSMIVCNTGSISLPKGNSEAGYAVYESRTLCLHDIDGKILSRMEF